MTKKRLIALLKDSLPYVELWIDDPQVEHDLAISLVEKIEQAIKEGV